MGSMSVIGPSDGVLWVVDDEKRLRAKQADMVSIDERFAVRWVTTMRKLRDENLDDLEFTKRRMEELGLWTTDRKREAHNIHYRYDPRRRKPRLIDKEIQRLRERVEQPRRSFDAIASTVARPERSIERRPAAKIEPKKPAVPTRIQYRTLAGVSETSLAMVAEATGITDLAYASDQEIWNAYISNGVRSEEARLWVNLLNGVTGGVSSEA